MGQSRELEGWEGVCVCVCGGEGGHGPNGYALPKWDKNSAVVINACSVDRIIHREASMLDRSCTTAKILPL